MPSERQKRKRENMKKRTEKYHRTMFITEYTRKKYPEVYNEADNFYFKLLEMYPNKTKLTASLHFKAWEGTLTTVQEQEKTPSTGLPTTVQGQEKTPPTDLSTQRTLELNIPLMNHTEVEDVQVSIPFIDIQPSILEEINSDTIQNIIDEIQESGGMVDEIERCYPNIFEDHDINPMIESEIDERLAELDPLEKELLKY